MPTLTACHIGLSLPHCRNLGCLSLFCLHGPRIGEGIQIRKIISGPGLANPGAEISGPGLANPGAEISGPGLANPGPEISGPGLANPGPEISVPEFDLKKLN